MNSIDFFVLITLILALWQGMRIGFFRQIGPLGGFWIGLVIGSILVPLVAPFAPDLATRALLSVAVVLGMACFISSLGQLIGSQLADTARILKIGWLDELLGAGARVVTTLFLWWLVASVFLSVSVPQSGQIVQQSFILSTVERVMPPIPTVVARLRTTIGFDAFPRVFSGLAPTPAAPVELPVPSEIAKAVAADRNSIMKVEGAGCGKLSAGSGFVAAPNLVVTNAHVLAGVRRPTVQDVDGRWYRATTVYFDPDLDIAVLRVNTLPAASLALNSKSASRGTLGAVIGYPGGGQFQAVPAGVTQEIVAVGHNIYDAKTVKRHVYELQTNIEPGNSGGPLVDLNGTVIGVVFAKSAIEEGIGYALVGAEVSPAIEQSKGKTASVSTGPCLAE